MRLRNLPGAVREPKTIHDGSFYGSCGRMPFLSLPWSPLIAPATATDKHLIKLAIGGLALLSKVATMIRDNGDIDSGEGGIQVYRNPAISLQV